jgi:hypothetical protein
MGLLDQGLFGLGGMGGTGGSSLDPSLLGGFYNPAEQKKQMLKQALLGAGISMLQNGKGDFGQVLGGSLAGGLQGASTAKDDYVKQALFQRQLQNDNEKQLQAANDRQREMGKRAALDKWIADQSNGMTPQQRAYAQVDPQGAATQYGQNVFKPPDSADEAFGTPLQIKNADGSFGYVMPMHSGGVKQLELKNGSQFIDTYNKAFQKAQGATEGDMVGKQNISAPQAIQSAENALQSISDVRLSPNKSWGTGGTSMLDFPGTPVRDFKNQVQGLKSGAFLTAIESMRGLGSLSDAEGAAATAAINRMDVSTSEEAFNAALDDYEKIVRQGLARSKSYATRANSGTPTQAQPQPIPSPQGSSQNLSDEQLLQMYGGQ